MGCGGVADGSLGVSYDQPIERRVHLDGELFALVDRGAAETGVNGK
jgi:hypothetical protein